uniref:C40 family peptidase n=1 Tax=Parolsenella massiliensis TaxID=1871022 RepID=UPI0009354F79|nr:C40 family peptidase [Parolsenella massiliensis]
MKIRTHIARATVAVALGATVLTGLPTLAIADTSAELQAKLDEANAHLNDLYSQAEQVSEQVNQTQVDLDNTNSEIEQKQAELASAQDTLSKRVASNYKTGGVSLVSILFDSTSFEDLVNRVTYASKVSDSDAQVIQQVKDIQNELNEKQSQQEQLLADQQSQQAELNDKVNEAQSYVSSLDQQVQDALAKEQAEREAQQEAERKAAEEKAAQQNNYVPEGNANAGNNNSNNNTNTNTNTNNGGGSDNGGSSNSGNSGNSGGYSGGGNLSSSARDIIISTAYSKIGCGYVYGASGPSNYDCSGLVQACYAAAGISVSHSSGSLAGYCNKPASQAEPGDIVWRAGHVGIYIGGGTTIEAMSPSQGVTYGSLSTFVRAGSPA